MNVQFKEFELNQDQVAPCIYGSYPHRTTAMGVVLSTVVKQELSDMLRSFNLMHKVKRIPYYRIDAYFDLVLQTVTILEINASFVDGWGTALNLTRASGGKVEATQLLFPQHFAVEEPRYEPEMCLLINELTQLGLEGLKLVELKGTRPKVPTYVYGRVGKKGQPTILPYDGLRLDNKLNLALLSREWQGQVVKLPRHYLSRFDSWEEVPEKCVLKFCDKNSPESKQVRASVILGKPAGKAPFLKRCYAEEKLLVQELVPPTTHQLGNCQLILFAIGNNPITGYVQFSPKTIINDDSVHGPLQWE